MTSLSRNHCSGYDSAHALPVCMLRWPGHLSQGSGYYSAEGMPAWVMKRLNTLITGCRCGFDTELSAKKPRQTNYLFSSSGNHSSRSDSAGEFHSQILTWSIHSFTSSVS